VPAAVPESSELSSEQPLAEAARARRAAIAMDRGM
jgi:hypothetical protein